jgi:hypothetical protein
MPLRYMGEWRRLIARAMARLTYLPTYLWLYNPCGPWPLFQFLNLYTFGRTSFTGDQPVARRLLTHKTTQIKNKRTRISMSRVGFEPTFPVFERAKTVHALDSAATVIGEERIRKLICDAYMCTTGPSMYKGRVYYNNKYIS